MAGSARSHCHNARHVGSALEPAGSRARQVAADGGHSRTRGGAGSRGTADEGSGRRASVGMRGILSPLPCHISRFSLGLAAACECDVLSRPGVGPAFPHRTRSLGAPPYGARSAPSGAGRAGRLGCAAQLRRWLPERALVLLADTSYAVLSFVHHRAGFAHPERTKTIRLLHEQILGTVRSAASMRKR